MADSQHNNDGSRFKPAWEIDRADENLRSDILDNRRRIEALEKAVHANGRPCLEDRMKAHVKSELHELRKHVDARDDHKQHNAEQSDLDLYNEIQENRREIKDLADKGDKRHEENDKRFRSLETKMAMAAGAIIVIQPLFALLLQILMRHMFGGQ